MQTSTNSINQDMDETTKWILDQINIQPGDKVEMKAELKPDDDSEFLNLKLTINGHPEFVALGYENQAEYQENTPMLQSYISQRLNS